MASPGPSDPRPGARARASRGAPTGLGRLGKALAIDRRHNGLDLTEETHGPLWLERRPVPRLTQQTEIANSPRINVEYAGAWAALPWRFYLPASRHVSVRPRRIPRTVTAGSPSDAPHIPSDDHPVPASEDVFCHAIGRAFGRDDAARSAILS